LAVTLAHELRNPLASILTGLYVMLHSGANEVAAQLARDRVERQARHVARIIGGVLDACRAGRDKPSLRNENERVSLAAVVIDAVETAGPLLSDRGHHLTVSLPPEPVSLLADPSHLHQVLTNLLTSAAQYADPGGKILLTAEAADGAVVLRVRDNGRGIAPDVLPRVFDLFQPGDRPGDRACGGLGIGLALVKSLVERHGGSVAAFSQGPGTGSEFVVRLPDCAPNVEGGHAPGGLAAVLSTPVMIGPWLRFADGRMWPVLLAAAVALTALLQSVRLYRARSARRWRAALDDYAALDIAHDLRRKAPPL
jgi:signal transduction histidine kinase